jgi:hypothetical protein
LIISPHPTQKAGVLNLHMSYHGRGCCTRLFDDWILCINKSRQPIDPEHFGFVYIAPLVPVDSTLLGLSESSSASSSSENEAGLEDGEATLAAAAGAVLAAVVSSSDLTASWLE